MTKLYPLRLTPSLRPKVWGATDLRPLAPVQPEPIGEIWFSFEQNTVADGPLAGRTLGSLIDEFGSRLMGADHRPQRTARRSAGQAEVAAPSAYFPILTKFLFPSQKLSVQVHPPDDYALRVEGGPGKTELWSVVAAEPGAAVALGLTEKLSPTELEESARSGEIEGLLNWTPVQAGDAVLIPAGLIHTLGPGMSICEIQQNSDLTYRLYDFGRPGPDGKLRELHIEQSAAVARHTAPPTVGRGTPIDDARWNRKLIGTCDYFAVEQIECGATLDYQPNPRRFELWLVLSGSGRLNGGPYQAGDCFLLPAKSEEFTFEPKEPTTLLRATEKTEPRT